MKTFAFKKKRSSPAILSFLPSRLGYRAPEVKVRQAEIRRILRDTGAQAKFTIGQPNDKYEQEADRITDEVMRMPDPRLQRQPEDEEEEETLQTKPLADQITPLVQRQEEPPEEEEELQTKSKTGETPEVMPSLESRIHAMKGSGRPLPEFTRNYFEPRFGRDFSNVRIHTDSKAGEMAKAVNAQAFTTGSNIAFAQGKYGPGTSSGKRLLAHELMHVVQQNGGSTLFSTENNSQKTISNSVELKDISHHSKYRNMSTVRSRQRIRPSCSAPQSGSEVLLRTPDFNQTLHLRQRYTYLGENGIFQSHDFSPDLKTGIRNWLTKRMRVFVNDERPFDTLSSRLLSVFRQAHKVLEKNVALRKSQRYTFAARIKISGASIQITDVRINGLSPTAELVFRQLESFPPMQWEPLISGSGTDFQTWVTKDEETPAPALDSKTTLNCWEAILLAAYVAKVVSWKWLHDLYVKYESKGDIAFAKMLSRGQRKRYKPPGQVPVRGDIVFFWSGKHLSHVGLATGRLNPKGASPEVLAFQGRFTEPRPPVKARIEPPAVHISSGRRMRIEYARPPW